MSTVKIFIALNTNTISGKLTKFFTGCYAYHIGFLTEDTGNVYDMNLLFRQIPLTVERAQHIGDEVQIFDLPEGVTLTEEDLIFHVLENVRELCKNKSMLANMYGFFDYLMYGFRWVYHLFGQSTPNFGGEICSEKIEVILIKHGWKTPFREVPSPCDFLKYFINK